MFTHCDRLIYCTAPRAHDGNILHASVMCLSISAYRALKVKPPEEYFKI